MSKYPYTRLANAVVKVSPEESDSDFKIALESVISGEGRLSDNPVVESDTLGNKFEPGDILFGKLRPYLAKVWVADRPGSFIGDFLRLTPKPGWDSRFLGYVLRSPEFIDRASAEAYGSKMPRIEWERLKNYRIPAPPLVEQKRIIDELDRELAEIDEFIAECTQLSTLTDERRLAAINSLIEPLLDNTTPIKHLGTLTSGLTLGATYNEPLKSYPYLRVANVQAGMVDLNDIKEVAVPPSVAPENMLQKDDVLMTEGGDRDKLGRGAIWSGEISPMLHQNHVFAFRCNKEKLLPEFLVFCLEASYARRYFENSARQSTNLASTNSTIVKNFRVPSICTDKQTKIIELLKSQVRTIESIDMSSSEITKILIERKNSSTHETITIPKPR